MIEHPEQWDRTVQVALQEGWPPAQAWDCNGEDGWLLLLVRQNTRVALAGDVLLLKLCNGTAERSVAYGYTSRGYTVRRLYVKYQRWWWNRRAVFGTDRRSRFFPATYWDRINPPRMSLPRPVAARVGRPERGPGDRYRIVDWPDELAGRPLVDPAIRQFALETRCTGGAASR